MKIQFRFFLSHVKIANMKNMKLYQVLLPILLRKRHQGWSVTLDFIEELQRLSLLKYFSMLCQKLIYDIAIIHSIKGIKHVIILYMDGQVNHL